MVARGEGGVEEDDEVSYHDCGLVGCKKTFAHTHIGHEGAGLPTDFVDAGLRKEN